MTLGDFSWTGYGTPLLQPRAAMTLATFNGVEFGDVQVEGNVPGSENLVELLAPVVVEADPRLSTFGISEEPCAHCGRHDWTEWDSEVNGVEHKTFRYEPATGESFHGKIGRRSGAGLILAGDALDGAEVFRFLQADWVVCTERVREAVETAELTNVGFRAIGEIR